MKFDPPLNPAILLRRYKRFLADVRLPDGSQTTVHCPNTGSMTNCLVEHSQCWYSTSANPKRKYSFTRELATTPGGHWAGINTGRANQLVEEALLAGLVPELQGFDSLKREVRYGDENSRVDFLLHYGDARCYLEVKSVTLGEPDGCGYFPDAVSERGRKHLRELAQIARSGHRAVLFYCVQHTGIQRVLPADHIDPAYGQALREAVSAGVEILAYRAHISPEEIRLCDALPVEVPVERPGVSRADRVIQPSECP